MKSIVCTGILLAITGCATTTPDSDNESIFDLIEQAETAPRFLNACPSGTVIYCVGDGSSQSSCSCVDSMEIGQGFDRYF
jgi:hypothetical protein